MHLDSVASRLICFRLYIVRVCLLCHNGEQTCIFVYSFRLLHVCAMNPYLRRRWWWRYWFITDNAKLPSDDWWSSAWRLLTIPYFRNILYVQARVPPSPGLGVPDTQNVPHLTRSDDAWISSSSFDKDPHVITSSRHQRPCCSAPVIAVNCGIIPKTH